MKQIAIVGATGAVGQQMIKDLEEFLNVPPENLRLFASPRSVGSKLLYRNTELTVEAYSADAFSSIDYVLMSAGSGFSKKHADEILAAGATIIDNSSAWRMDDRYPLVVPEVNGHLLKELSAATVIANPNCSTIQMVMALKPIQEKFGLKMVNVSTYQSVSGSGQKGIAALDQQVKQHYKIDDQTSEIDYAQIAFNVVPAIDTLQDDGWCFEEIKMIKETHKILGDDKIQVMATTARVPSFYCHCESVSLQLEKPSTASEIEECLSSFKDLVVYPQHHYEKFPDPISVRGSHKTHVARVRTMYGRESSDWIQFWIVADNLKKGAATNAVQILEKLIS